MDPADIVRRTAERLLKEGGTPPDVPGVPTSGTPAASEPTEPREPLPPKNDQTAPAGRSATGLGLAVPDSDTPAPELTSPALSQVGGEWPVDGRMIGIVVDPDDSEALTALESVRTALRGKGALPLVIASRGGMLADGVPVQRTFDTARSVEF